MTKYMSISEKTLHMIDCKPIEKIKGENSEKYYCVKNCPSKPFLEQKLLILHMRTEHRKKIKYMKKCINCEKSLATASEKILHMLKCIPKNEYYCVICPCKPFLTQNLMIEHMRTEHRKKIKKMKKCINCKMSLDFDELYCNEAEYMNASEKILHMLKCFPKNEAKTRTDCNPIKENAEKKLSCVVCPELNFKNQQTFLNHIQVVNLWGKRFKLHN